MVEVGQSGCFRAMWLYSDRSSCNFAKWLKSGKMVVFGQNGCIRKEVVVNLQSG